jgi:hypothetical protein
MQADGYDVSIVMPLAHITNKTPYRRQIEPDAGQQGACRIFSELLKIF